MALKRFLVQIVANRQHRALYKLGRVCIFLRSVTAHVVVAVKLCSTRNPGVLYVEYLCSSDFSYSAGNFRLHLRSETPPGVIEYIIYSILLYFHRNMKNVSFIFRLMPYHYTDSTIVFFIYMYIYLFVI